MDNNDIADAFNNCCYSDVKYDEFADEFLSCDESYNKYVLISKLTDFLKFEPVLDVLDIYEQVCDGRIFHFSNMEVFVKINFPSTASL